MQSNRYLQSGNRLGRLNSIDNLHKTEEQNISPIMKQRLLNDPVQKDWSNVIKSQIQVFDKMKEDSKIYQTQVKKAYADELKTAEQQKLQQKREEEVARATYELQQKESLEQQNYKIKNWALEDNKRQKQQLADEYGTSITNQKAKQQEIRQLEMIDEQRRIQEAHRSLELEKIVKKQKLDNYRKQLDAQLNMKGDNSNIERKLGQDFTQEELMLLHMNAQRELNNEEQYRQKFVKKDEVMKNRQQQFQEMVMNQNMHKDFLINQTINQREEDYKKQQEQRENDMKRMRMAMSEDRQRTLEYQIQEKNQQKMMEREKYMKNMEDRFKQENDYKQYVIQQQQQKLDQQKGYRQILDQMVIKNNQPTGRSSNLEGLQSGRGNQDQGNNFDVGIIPGQISVSKYLADARKSPRDGGQQLLLDDQYQIEDSQKYKSLLYKDDSINQSMNQSLDYSNIHSQKNLNQTTNLKGKMGSINSSLQDAAQMQLNLFNPKASYNPITNPIPIVNQNPYISKGRLDIGQSQRVRGKIMKSNEMSLNNSYAI
ncbi:UNKNOWN [Stylonychia lemnae]|uniref:Uncharacterized protein n=1 Tax=Stylonychia lemnae TaxID=5949 RepID=A0A077ZZF8_STYLE|nr:UNKNOWN [Stylonychia lemnae]|eukprot:CDW74977.1 UNKNOWN [Stylonychia lemnae]